MKDLSGGVNSIAAGDFPFLGGRLRDARRERGFRQRELAALVGIGPNTIYRWEKGATAPSFLIVLGLAAVLDKPYQWFYGLPVSDEPSTTVQTASPREIELRSRVDTLVGLIFAGAEARRLSLENVLGFQEVPEDLQEAGGDDASDFISLYSLPAAAGAWSPAVEDDQLVGRIRVDRRPFHRISVNPGQCDLIPVSGDSMEPTLEDGSMVLVDRGSRSLLEGRIFVIRTPDGLLVKRVRMDGVRWLAISDNPSWSTEVISPDSAVIGEVRWAMISVSP